MDVCSVTIDAVRCNLLSANIQKPISQCEVPKEMAIEVRIQSQNFSSNCFKITNGYKFLISRGEKQLLLLRRNKVGTHIKYITINCRIFIYFRWRRGNNYNHRRNGRRKTKEASLDAWFEKGEYRTLQHHSR